MSRDDDLWRSRIRAEATVRPDPGTYRPGTPSFVGKVISTGSALGVGKFCKVVPVAVTGTEADGSAGGLTAGTAVVFAYPVGPGTPATGDHVVVRRVAHRWVFDEPTGGPPVTTSGVGCSTVCPAGLPLAITITPLAPVPASPAWVTTVCNFSTTGSGNSTTDNNLFSAGGNPTFCWWSGHISDGATGYFQWCYNCSGSPGRFGYGSLALMHNVSGTGGAGIVNAFEYVFDATNSCSPFLQTGGVQNTPPSQQWTASG
jgi:hypothetical protein